MDTMEKMERARVITPIIGPPVHKFTYLLTRERAMREGHPSTSSRSNSFILSLPVDEGEGHRHDGEDGEGEGHHPHHEATGPQVHATATSAEAGHSACKAS
jgi:hypothetical protein